MAEDLRLEAMRELARRELARRQSQTAEPKPTGPEYSENETFAAHLGNEAALGYGNEMLAGWKANLEDAKRALSGDVRGAVNSQVGGLKDLVGMGQDPSLGDVVLGRDGASDWTRRYRDHRDSAQRALDEMERQNPKSALAGGITGGVATGLLIPGGTVVRGASLGAKVGQAAKVGAVLGGAAGLGHSDADLTKGEFGEALKDTATGAAFGAGGGAVGVGLGHGLGKLRDYARTKLGPMAEQKLLEAKLRAEAMAGEKVSARLKSLRGIAGGEAQKASRLTENIRRIEGWDAVPDDPGALENAARAAQNKAASLRQQARASGIEGHGPIDAAGALVSAGSKAEAAGKAAEMAGIYESAAQDLFDRAMKVRSGSAGVPGGMRSLPASPEVALAKGGQGPYQNVLNVRDLRNQAMHSPEFMAQENQVLLHALEDLPDQRAAAEAARAAYRNASERAVGDVANLTDDLMSGKAAWDAVRARLLRYGPPLAASAAGAMFGGPVGAGVGAVAGLAAGRGAEALAGAGMRPAIRSFVTLVTKYPAVQSAVWGTVKRAVGKNPQALGKYGSIIQTAEARFGEAGARMAHEELLRTDPGYGAMVAQQAAPDIDALMEGAQ